MPPSVAFHSVVGLPPAPFPLCPLRFHTPTASLPPCDAELLPPTAPVALLHFASLRSGPSASLRALSLPRFARPPSGRWLPTGGGRSGSLRLRRLTLELQPLRSSASPRAWNLRYGLCSDVRSPFAPRLTARVSASPAQVPSQLGLPPNGGAAAPQVATLQGTPLTGGHPLEPPSVRSAKSHA